MLALIATLHAQGELGKIGRLVLKSTHMGIYLSPIISFPLLFAGKIIRAHWVTPAYAAAWPILMVLVIAKIIRLVGSPYSVAVLGTGQQKIVVISPLIEGSVNLTCSVILGMRMGALGVALGTLIGSVVGRASVAFVFISRTTQIRITRRYYLQNGILASTASVM